MHSPLGSPLPPSDVAEDFKESLKDLHVNSRVEINTLTMIAKENTEQALAISRVLENHIKSTAPPRKLPALYVLDSIVKNVGTPYTLYLGQNLYSTFIDAYTVVDSRTRASMEAMLGTWKFSVPGSMDTRPVFPVDTTSTIENALQKARMAFQQHQQKQPQMPTYRQPHALPPRPMTGPVPPPSWGTPPANGTRYPPPPPSHAGSPYPGYPVQNGYPQHQQMHPYYQRPPSNSAYPTPVPPQQHYYPPPQPTPYQPPQPPPPPDFAKINADIENLINSMKYKLATNMHDSSLQARLKAMLDLKEVISSKPPSQQEWDNIRSRLSLLIQQENSPPYNTPPYTRQAPTPSQFPHVPPPHSQPPSVPPPPQPAPQQNLAELLASFAPPRGSTPQTSAPSAPPPTSAASGIANVMGVAPEAVPRSLAKDNDLISSLIKSGLIPPATPQQHTHSRSNSVQQAHSAYAPPPATSAPLPAVPTAAPTASPAPGPPPSNDLAALLAQLTGAKPPPTSQPPQPVQPPVTLTSASLKVPRPDLINRRLYKNAPSQCMTCGRRFAGTAEGKARKARHLDFHFRTNARVSEAEAAGRRGVCRAWLPNVRQWIAGREWDDADASTADQPGKKEDANGAEAAGVNSTNGRKKEDQTPYVRVPDQSSIEESVKNGQSMNVCPICQEEFKGVWHDGAQEWVWLDAVKVGSRVYHASCYEEVRRDQEKSRKATPAAVLGKRRLEGEADEDGKVGKSPRREEELKN